MIAQSLKNSLEQFFQEHQQEGTMVEMSVEDAWINAVGEPVRKITKITKIQNNILFVKVSTPEWRNELNFQKKDILILINDDLKKKTIKDIRFI